MKNVSVYKYLCLISLFFLLLPLALLPGCAGTDNAPRYSPSLAQPPAFFTGAAALLLTNSSGYFCHLSLTRGSGQEVVNVEGQLFARGSKLAFMPQAITKQQKRNKAAGISFVWDALDNRGYVLSEGLQAYAAVGAIEHFTNITSTVISSYEGEDVTIESAAGDKRVFHVLRDPATRFPTRVRSLSNEPFTLTLSKFRTEQPPPELFEIPDGFAKYDSGQAMLDEVYSRQQNLRRKTGQTIITDSFNEPPATDPSRRRPGGP